MEVGKSWSLVLFTPSPHSFFLLLFFVYQLPLSALTQTLSIRLEEKKKKVRQLFHHKVFLMSTIGVLCGLTIPGAGIAHWLERQTRDRKVASSNPGRNGEGMFFLQSQLCVLTLIRCPFHPVLPE